jgi:hypothetical protein
MKKAINVFAFIALIVFSLSCKKKKVDELTEFDIEYTANLSVPSASIAVNSPTTSVEFVTPNIPSRQLSVFSAKKTAKYLVDEIKFTRFDLTAAGTGANLDFLKSVSIYMKAANAGEQLIVGKSSFPTGITATSLELDDVNIKKFIFEDNFQLRVVAIFDATSTVADQTLKMDQTVHVKATVLK